MRGFAAGWGKEWRGKVGMRSECDSEIDGSEIRGERAGGVEATYMISPCSLSVWLCIRHFPSLGLRLVCEMEIVNGSHFGKQSGSFSKS